MKLEFSRQIFEKYSKITFHENPRSGSGVVSCLRTDRHTDITKLTVAFRNSANAPKNGSHKTYSLMYIKSKYVLIAGAL